MAFRKTSFAPGEWYHCYTRSIDGNETFTAQRDYERFTEALYLSNNADTIPRGNFQHLNHEEILTLPRSQPIVSIGAYCLMPNHFHILMREEIEGGISRFMQRLGTSYAKYFNLKHDRIGNVFVKPFRSKHIEDDRYLKRVTEYIHLNPVELFESGWKRGQIRNVQELHRLLGGYLHSSLIEFSGVMRTESAIINPDLIEVLQGDENPFSLRALLAERATYFAELN